MNRQTKHKGTPLKKGGNKKNSSKIDRFYNSPNMGDIIRKRMTIPTVSVSSTAGNIIAVTTYSSSLVQSQPASEWASFAARYQQYRVLAMRFSGVSLQNTNTTQVSPQGLDAIYSGDFIGTSVPTTAAQVLSDENAKLSASYRDLIVSASNHRNPNSMLWNPTSAAIPAANAFGVALCSATTASLPASLVIYAAIIEFQVEFRGSQ
jgi:hypothetical protein